MRLRQILFGFRGRIRRSTYWLASLGSGVVLVTVLVVVVMTFGGMAVLSGASENSGAVNALVRIIIVWLAPLYGLSLWISLALSVKRCHDRNYPGVMVMIQLMPIVGVLWALIDLGFIEGKLGPNQYGPSPKQIYVPPTPPQYAQQPNQQW